MVVEGARRTTQGSKIQVLGSIKDHQLLVNSLLAYYKETKNRRQESTI